MSRSTTGPTSGRKDEFVRHVDGAEHLCALTGSGANEDTMQQAALNPRSVEIGQPQYQRFETFPAMRGQHELFLFEPHAALERVRLARMIFANRIAMRAAIRIHGADQNEALDAGGRHASQRFLHQRRVLRELVVGHADEIDHGLQTGGRGANRGGVVGVPGDDLSVRVVTEAALQCLARAADHPIIAARRTKRRGNALTRCARGTE
ncbi:hypothetical protein QFZ89_002123 [Paraburkholderia youngii]